MMVAIVGVTGGFTIHPAHFVERHGLVVIIALGESVVAIGAGAADHRMDFGLIAVAVLGLMLLYLLFWAYFGGDDARAEHSLAGDRASSPGPRRGLNWPRSSPRSRRWPPSSGG